MDSETFSECMLFSKIKKEKYVFPTLFENGFEDSAFPTRPFSDD